MVELELLVIAIIVIIVVLIVIAVIAVIALSIPVTLFLSYHEFNGNVFVRNLLRCF